MASLQLQQYLQLRADGVSVSDAAWESGIGLGEAELHEADIASGELKLPRASARAREDNQPRRNEMATVARNTEGDTGSAVMLKNFIERVERLHEEKDGIQDDIKDVYKEAKSHGFDTNVMRTLVKRRAMGLPAAHEFDALLEAYENAVQHQIPLPLQAEIRTPGAEEKKRHLETVN